MDEREASLGTKPAGCAAMTPPPTAVPRINLREIVHGVL